MSYLSKAASDYLRLLNLPLEAPTFHYLERICHAQLNTFPFENISKLIYYRDRYKDPIKIPSFDLFVKNHKLYHFGGTCYTLNSNLMLLLKEIGFDCYHIMLGKEHMAIIVTIDNDKFYVDCGAAFPFFKPVSFENDPHNITKFGNDNVRLLPLQSGTNNYQYIRYTNGKQSGKAWRFNSQQVSTISDFDQPIKLSNRPRTPFMIILRCQLYQTDKNRSVSLVNNKFAIRYDDGTTSDQRLSSVSEIEQVISNEFMLSKLPVAEAIDVLQSLDIDIFSNNNK